MKIPSIALVLSFMLCAPTGAFAQQAEAEPSEAGEGAESGAPEQPEPVPENDEVAEAAPTPSAPEQYEDRSSVAESERANLHFELATAHFEAGRYDQALVELQTVRELSSRDDVLYNMARCYEAMGRTRPALDHYRRFLDAVGEGELHDDAERRVERLAVRREEAEAEQLADEGPGVGTIIGLGVGGVGLLVGGVFGILTLIEDGALSDGCGATLTCTGEDLADIRVYRGVADLAFVLAAIGGTAGLIALFLWMNEGEEGEADDGVSAAVVPWVAPGEGAGAAATVHF